MFLGLLCEWLTVCQPKLLAKVLANLSARLGSNIDELKRDLKAAFLSELEGVVKSMNFKNTKSAELKTKVVPISSSDK